MVKKDIGFFVSLISILHVTNTQKNLQNKAFTAFIWAMEKKKAVVIGAGISGLSAAIELVKKGFDVTVLERENRAGGVIGTITRDSFKAESGSNSVMVNSQKTLDFLNEVGLKDKIEISGNQAKNRFFVKSGKTTPVPMGPLALLTTPLFSFWGKLRMFCEPFIKPEDPESDPSIAEFTTHRFGKEVLDYAMNPFMAGVYAANPEKLSTKNAFPPFWNLVQKYGSVIKGGMKARKEKMAAGNFFKPIMISFKGGMQTLTDGLAEELGDRIKLGAKIISIDSSCDGWEVSWGTDKEDVCEIYSALVLAVPAPEIAKLPLNGSLSALLEPLSKIIYAPIVTYTMGFRRQDVAHLLNGFGVLTPEKENLSILGSLFISSIFEDRAPKDCVTLTNYIGGMRHPEFTKLSREDLRDLILKDLQKLLGTKGRPIFEEMFVWKHAIAQYNVGYQEFLDIINDIEKSLPSLTLVGAYRGGVGVSTCLENGVEHARKLADRLS